MPTLALFLVHAGLVIGLPFALWRWGGVRRWVPLVVVQIAVGLALGPSGLGRVAPGLWVVAFPPGALAALDGLVWLGVCYFAFATGLHVDLSDFAGRGRAFGATALSTFAVPTFAGCGVGVVLLHVAPQAVGDAASAWAFVLGVGIAVGVTALPVLAAILREMGLSGSRLGAEALGCAAANDAALWLMVAVLLAGVQGGSPWRLVAVAGGAVLLVAVLALAVRPLLGRLVGHADGVVSEREVAIVSVGLLACALATEMLGLHAVVGAFAFGTVVPKALARDLLGKFESFLTVVLLPFFFIATGLKTDLGGVGGGGMVCVLTTAAAVAAKLASAAVPARMQGWAWRDALALGALVGCKGLMELVVLTLLLDRGIVSAAGFSGMVMMALLTTALARPLAGALLGR